MSTTDAGVVVAVVAVAAAIVQESSRKELLFVAAAGLALTTYRLFFGDDGEAASPPAVPDRPQRPAAETVREEPATAAPQEAEEKSEKETNAEVVSEATAVESEENPHQDPEDNPHQDPEPEDANEQAPEKEVPAPAPEKAAVASDNAVAIEYVVAFDFDKCLMSKHWWGTHRNNPIDTIHPTPEDFAHENIGELLKLLLNTKGVGLAVASFGRHDVIHKAIVSVLGDDDAEKVFITTPGDFPGFRDGCSMGANFKNLELQRVAEHYGVEVEQIAFFDDDKNNIREAKNIGVNAHTTAPFHGIYDKLVFEHIGRPELGQTSS